MHHKLDIHPIPENVFYINELSMVTEVVYETKKRLVRLSPAKPYQMVAFYLTIMFVSMFPWI